MKFINLFAAEIFVIDTQESTAKNNKVQWKDLFQWETSTTISVNICLQESCLSLNQLFAFIAQARGPGIRNICIRNLRVSLFSNWINKYSVPSVSVVWKEWDEKLNRQRFKSTKF